MLCVYNKILFNKYYKEACDEKTAAIKRHKNFIKDHIKNAEENRFIHGGRVFLSQKITLERLRSKEINFHFFNNLTCKISDLLNVSSFKETSSRI